MRLDRHFVAGAQGQPQPDTRIGEEGPPRGGLLVVRPIRAPLGRGMQRAHRERESRMNALVRPPAKRRAAEYELFGDLGAAHRRTDARPGAQSGERGLGHAPRSDGAVETQKGHDRGADRVEARHHAAADLEPPA